MPPLDDRLFRLLYDPQRGALTTVARVLSAVGGGWAMVALAPFLVRKSTRRFATWLVATLTGTAIVVALLKLTIGRDRPCFAYAPLRQTLLDSPTDCSFPSGHAAGSFTFALFLAHVLLDRRPRPPFARTIATLIIMLAACVAVSRVVLGFHFPADVLAGTVLGSAIGGVVGRRFTARG